MVLPRSDREIPMMIAKCAEKLSAICLGQGRGASRFAAFECDAFDNWKGLLVPDVAIELDEASLCQTDNVTAPIGTITRKYDKLIVNGMKLGEDCGWPNAVTVMDGLPLCADHLTATFCKWQIVLGAGESKRVLYNIDVSSN